MVMTDLLLAIIVALLGGIAFFVKKILNKTDSLESSFKPVVPAIVEIQGKFSQAGHSILFPLTVTPGSPLKLTNYGEQLMESSGFDKILEKNNPILAPLKDYAYSTGLSTEILLQPAGILLRDKVLKEIDL